ncbi:MAG: copper chaperone CopZ [Eubacteriales bacterium]|nr:copper chaperone CopZ [Eubacteriales bacterium]
MKKITLNVEGMSCSHCVKAVKDAVAALDGVAEVEVDLKGKTATVEYNAEEIKPERIQEAIEEEGYDVE